MATTQPGLTGLLRSRIFRRGYAHLRTLHAGRSQLASVTAGRRRSTRGGRSATVAVEVDPLRLRPFPTEGEVTGRREARSPTASATTAITAIGPATLMTGIRLRNTVLS